MNIDHPLKNQISQLKFLWQQAFGDTDEEINAFFDIGFSDKRCFCATTDGQVAAALYWFDCTLRGKKIAYLYAIATEENFRGQGIASKLISHTHAHLQNSGYAGAVLVPSEKSLFGFYERLGYTAFGGIGEFTCQKADAPVPISKIDRDAYAALRKTYLPEGSILQEDTLLDCLDAFYRGEDFICTAMERNGTLFVPELLGNTKQASHILAAFGMTEGTFRTPGNDRPFAMFYPFEACPTPAYFGLALD